MTSWGEHSIGFGQAWEGKVIFMSMVWQKGQFYKPSSLENVPLSFVHRIGHGGRFECHLHWPQANRLPLETLDLAPIVSNWRKMGARN
jgi:hypothetical protein